MKKNVFILEKSEIHETSLNPLVPTGEVHPPKSSEMRILVRINWVDLLRSAENRKILRVNVIMGENERGNFYFK